MSRAGLSRGRRGGRKRPCLSASRPPRPGASHATEPGGGDDVAPLRGARAKGDAKSGVAQVRPASSEGFWRLPGVEFSSLRSERGICSSFSLLAGGSGRASARRAGVRRGRVAPPRVPGRRARGGWEGYEGVANGRGARGGGRVPPCARSDGSHQLGALRPAEFRRAGVEPAHG